VTVRECVGVVTVRECVGVVTVRECVGSRHGNGSKRAVKCRSVDGSSMMR
jgi:hypothetical protein